MRREQKSESPSKTVETPSQKQDPLERRRMQNRLSQRNHRRKIRDRIAKLQERVIANELRAAAALNGWDKPYASSPFMSPRHTHYPQYQEPELSFGSPDQSPLSTEPSTPFYPSYSFPSPSLYSADIGISQPSDLSGDPSCLFDSTCADLPSPSLSNRHGIPLMIDTSQSNIFHDPWNGNMALRNQNSCNDLVSLGSIDQATIYVATENALPQIIHSLKTTMSESKIIILVPPTSASRLPSQMHSPTGTNPLSLTESLDQMNYSSKTLLNFFNTPSQYPTQSSHIPSQQPLPRTWAGISSGPSAGLETCYNACPLQKQGALSSQSFPAMSI